ncbi:pancreatic triacylglycerol lipase-like isoform X2 [Stegodyphus dumicola]|uniref:pancreatic triacylglycerol lipase-like isoform X2 n=1 Tax=Stegodyphus dumicola TaxID=202533 RepID=UPI0015A90CDF|nr:pancreatic triacylglycerol lipase-like isoform X2 [Stegodyphus dumicola]
MRSMKSLLVTSSCVLLAVLSQVHSYVLHSNISNSQNEEFHAKAKEVCMKELGCFAITPDFKHILHRPINVLPNDRVAINTRCLLYTRRNAKEPEQLLPNNKKSISESNFDAKNPTKFIVHGFMDSEIFGPWMARMKDEFLLHGDYNIIIVDWSGGNKAPYYQATANTRVVAAEVALIITTLEKYAGIKRENCHIIGHSLGAHIAGYVGDRLKRLGRITGCDPAEPYFQNMPPSVRLDPTDAQYVDVIHSDATNIKFIGFGMSHMVGHVDFFPNNGRKQPGCKVDKFKSFITDGLVEGIRRFASCNHQRALDFMYYTINYRKIVPVGYQCSNWETFLQGKCAECGPDTKKCAIMGMRADEYKSFKNDKVQRAYYLKTSGKAPFLLYHYQISIKFLKPKTSDKDVKGTIDVALFGSKQDEIFHVQDKAADLVLGSRYQYLVTTDKELGDIQSVTLQWYSSSLNPLKLLFKPKLYVEYISVVPMNVIEKSPRKMTNRVFCGKPKVAIMPKTTTSFLRDNKCLKFL